MLILIFLVAASALVIYAAIKYYGSTPSDKSVLLRVWGAVVLASGAIFGAIMSWVHGVTAP